MKRFAFPLLFLVLFFVSCSTAIKQEDLYGRWNYVRVDNSNPQDTLPDGELELQSPAIIFSPEDNLVIEWGGKKLSSGKFRLDGKMIRYTETLEGGQTREFPFLINSLDEKELVFQTMERSTTTVVARRVIGDR
ncbi:hypothetical protein [Daejeonella sp. JGW-45]|uniref:hypothetical protein n=1 Tax=Daejeonella sp. JGW-45 TaxID=3034148 RepID=UPI0023ED3C74|nr:hypothetical protein [Daejeonella sp. JGW-45]